MIKAVIFDMDGVLIDAKEWHYEAFNRALGLFGFTISHSDHVAVFDGLPTHTKLDILSEDYGLPKGLHRFINEMKQLYTIEMVHTRCKPTFTHEYALSNLKRDGLLLAVASNSIRPTVDLMMQRAHLDAYLDESLSASDVTKPKPDPDIYIKAIERLGLQPLECVVVEDNKNGIQAAREAGANVLVVETVHDVNLQNIRSFIERVNAKELV